MIKTPFSFGTKLVDFTFKEVHPNIFAVIIRNDYDRAMLFCRYQEFYESPYSEVKGKSISLEHLMKIYTKKTKRDVFTYPHDWGGYNIPSNVLMDSWKKLNKYPTEYCPVMKKIIELCKVNNGGNPKFYLIGVDGQNSLTMQHEIAHGLYYTNRQYKKEMDDIIKTIKPTIYNRLKKPLLYYGYENNKRIINDEIQAFMSTGKFSDWSDEDCKKYIDKFVEVFKKYTKNVKKGR